MSEFDFGTDYGNLFRDEYDLEEELERKKRRVVLDRMRDLGMGPDSPLETTQGIIENYDSRKLSSLNKVELGMVRAARFRNGLFLSFRMDYNDWLLQNDFSFKNEGNPTITTWSLKQTPTGIERSNIPLSSSNDYHLRHTMTGLVNTALEILEQEAGGERPWSHAYTPVEIANARLTRNITYDVRKIQRNEFGKGPTGEPYL